MLQHDEIHFFILLSCSMILLCVPRDMNVIALQHEVLFFVLLSCSIFCPFDMDVMMLQHDRLLFIFLSCTNFVYLGYFRFGDTKSDPTNGGSTGGSKDTSTPFWKCVFFLPLDCLNSYNSPFLICFLVFFGGWGVGWV